MIINKSLRAKMSLQDGANVKIVEKITRINAKMCGFLWRYSTRHSIDTKTRTSLKLTAIKYCVKYTGNQELPTYSHRAREKFKRTLSTH